MKVHHLFLLYIIVLLISPKRYISFLPTIPIYPDNSRESLTVLRYTKSMTPYYRDLFTLTDPSVSYAFAQIVPKSVKELDDIILQPNVRFPILFFKYTINRCRPKQMIPGMHVLKSETADTPAYPSGHAYQAYFLAKRLSENYPEKRNTLWKLADDCALSRVYAGLHYPSDNNFSKTLVKILY